MLLTTVLELVALTGGTVHTMTPDEAPRAATVLIEGDRIQAILAPGEEIPATARRIDVTGLHLVPGLIDGMSYFDPDHDTLHVAQGITTIRDVGSDPVIALLHRMPEYRDRVPGPALLTGGAVIDGRPPSSVEAMILDNPAMADELLPILLNEDVDFLSIQLGLGREAYGRVLEIAKENELDVWGPLPRALSLAEALAAGQAGVLFLDGLLPDGVGWPLVQPPACKPAIERLAANGAGIVPLLHATSLRTVDQAAEDFPFALLDPLYEYQWNGELAYRNNLRDDQYQRVGERIAKKQRVILKDMHAAGVKLLPGSAAPHPWLVPGRGLHDELAHWESAGIPPADILRYATLGAAELLGIADERGSLAPGKVADVVCVKDDPSAGIGALRDPETVVVRGHVLEREQIDDMLTALANRITATRERLAKPIEVAEPEVPAGEVVLAGIADVWSFGWVIRAERYAVVREPDGALTYCSRTQYREIEGQEPMEMEVLQRTREGKLDEYRVVLKTKSDAISSQGLWTAQQFRIERRMNGKLVDTKRVRNRVTCLDASSVTSLLLLAQVDRPEPFQVISLHETLEPELLQWAMRVGGTETVEHQILTHKGLIPFRNTDAGSVELARYVVGGGIIELTLREEETFGGPGLPLPERKLELMRQAREAAAAAEAAAAKEAEEGAPAGAGEGG